MPKEAKKPTGTLLVTYSNAIREIIGTLVEQTEEFIVVDVPRKRSSKVDRKMFPLSTIDSLLVTGDDVIIYLRGDVVDEYPNITIAEVSSGFFSGTSEEEGTSYLVRPGLWSFVNSADDEAAKGAKKPAAAPAKGKPATAAKEEKPAAKSKKEEAAEEEAEEYWPEEGDKVKLVTDDEEEVTGKVTAVTPKSVTIGEDKYLRKNITSIEKAKGGAAAKSKKEEEAAEEEAADEDYEPKVGDVVVIKQEGEDDVTGTCEAVTAKSITVDGEKYMRKDVTVELGVEGEGEGEEEYDPEVGHYVTVSAEDEDDVSGEVTAVTAKSVTVSVDGEETKFKREEVTIAQSEPPKKKGSKGIKEAKAKGDEADEKEAKGSKKPAAGKKEAGGDDDNW